MAFFVGFHQLGLFLCIWIQFSIFYPKLRQLVFSSNVNLNPLLIVQFFISKMGFQSKSIPFTINWILHFSMVIQIGHLTSLVDGKQ